MAYSAGQFRFNVRGSLPNGESFSNTWTAEDTAGGQDPQDFADMLHDFYEAWVTAGDVNTSVHVTSCSIKALDTGLLTSATWSTIDGTVSTSMLPTECAVRVSLSGPFGERGGPFLSGFNAGAVDTFGSLDSGAATYLHDALVDFNAAAVAADWAISIDLPSTSSVVAATLARVGHVFDVIRKRRNDIPESYVSVPLN